ncbi:MAG: hypothetical protein E7678_03550 [Ruminococcaceae bacterium]|nr:hypothetical protein [Oscillospiraceae bacterium]
MKTIKIPANTSVLCVAVFTGYHPYVQFIIDAYNKSFYVKDEFILDSDGEIVFGNCVGDVKLPKGITKVGNATFIGNELMESVEIPEGVEVIEDDAFFKYAKLKRLFCQAP